MRFLKPLTCNIIFGVLTIIVLASCSSAPHLQEEELMLNSVKITSDSKIVNPSNYRMYIRQESNSKWFNLFKVPLGIYCLSGNDSTKSFNKLLRKIGEPPVIYSQEMTDYSIHALSTSLQSRGFYQAYTTIDTLRKQHKVNLCYQLHPGSRTYVRKLSTSFDSDVIQQIYTDDSLSSNLHVGMPLDYSLLSQEQKRIVSLLRNQGYYHINKDYLSFEADTLDPLGAHLTMYFKKPVGVDSANDYRAYKIGKIHVFENKRFNETTSQSEHYKDIVFHFDKKRKLSRKTYKRLIYFQKDSLFRETDIQTTYGALNSLSAIDFTTIQLKESSTDSAALDCQIQVRTAKRHGISMELEGTNTSGDLGAAIILGYTNNNTFGASESFSLKLRGAYEAITGLEGYNNHNYTEYSAETRLKFPEFLLPWFPEKLSARMAATSEVSLLYDSQNRPEFHRRVLTADWGYRWSHRNYPNLHHRFDLVSLNYVFMPWVSDTFRKEYLEGNDPHYAILRQTYDNLFIMKMGYSFVYTSLKNPSQMGLYQTNGWQFRFAAETAGNILQAFSSATRASKNDKGQYELFNIPFSQYAKFDLDFSKSFVINSRNSVAFHAAAGFAFPYGNSDLLPYEKRYFSGGANSVRGWSVRELGPGRFSGTDGKIDFINQTGNLKLDLSLEFRTRLFWKLHGAFFVDAGNVWNTSSHAHHPGGTFKLQHLYQQLAVAYGLGIRLDFNYFLLRFDGGMKAINPAEPKGPLHYPIIHPNFSRDFTFHFAVGMPF